TLQRQRYGNESSTHLSPRNAQGPRNGDRATAARCDGAAIFVGGRTGDGTAVADGVLICPQWQTHARLVADQRRRGLRITQDAPAACGAQGRVLRPFGPDAPEGEC